jgi:hypothetical protein
MYVIKVSSRSRWDCDVCKHPAEWHEHYHAGDYCGRCSCAAYRRSFKHRILDWMSW